jgi:hypothetical protein
MHVLQLTHAHAASQHSPADGQPETNKSNQTRNIPRPNSPTCSQGRDRALVRQSDTLSSDLQYRSISSPLASFH